ncbi:hypothetical protein A3G56_00665 [Candidatus Falkowbacteria bacterium RIFCSPLOWO2_12_FULL_45_10]|uniref:Uncharacterized protein n=1 Tax=Candidatus Falkowbacteria bacterium RIFCSPLOWO2_12_FULL_45_10 TaxID=1797990 RepID=A0A1F5RX37_9BACT|nr:MAG: hypothetical protein A3G56_00665 [Candidatus Falkowbacteria bacterium RIFCSPLOWO2_12_FULL_45_10]
MTSITISQWGLILAGNGFVLTLICEIMVICLPKKETGADANITEYQKNNFIRCSWLGIILMGGSIFIFVGNYLYNYFFYFTR